MLIEYPKIHQLGKKETLGILIGTCTIQEKVDGANVSIWMGKSEIKCGSRTRELSDNGFNGFVGFVKDNQSIKDYLTAFPRHRLYGEWLVQHTISYNSNNYKRMYLFDILDEDGKFLPQNEVEKVAKEIGLRYPQIFGIFENPTEESLKEFVGKTNLGDKGEGIIIKNLDFKNEFSDLCYAKMVAENFKESNAIPFGGNDKTLDTYWEIYIVNKYCTLARVQKIMHKIQPEINEKLDLKHIPRVSQTCYHDLITEEMWEIQAKVVNLNFRSLKLLCGKKFIEIYKEIIEELTKARIENVNTNLI